MKSARTFFEFDDALTGPLHGFTGAHDYYERSSSIHFLDQVRVPTLLMSAWDDPFLPQNVLASVRNIAQRSSHLSTDFTNSGGHVGWVAGQLWSQRYHMESRMVNWLADGS